MAEPTDKDTRGPVNLRIKFRSESLQQFIERYGVDVSRGGIFIRTREPLPVGTRLKLDFQLVDTVPLFQGDGTVVWIREHDASRAGVTPGMGVRFDRLTTESQKTLDTILEEKIRLQQSGVAPGSIAKAGAGIAVRRPSGAFATIEAGGAKAGAGGPPPLPFDIKPDVPAAAAAPGAGAAPVSPMPTSTTRSGPHPTTSSIFNRPRTTSGRTVPVPSALFEAPTAADIDKALSVLEEKGGAPPVMPVAPTVVNRQGGKEDGKATDDDPTRVFDSSASQEFSANDAITGKGEVLPETGVPVAAEGGELTERREVDPTSGEATVGGAVNGAVHKADRSAESGAASLDAPLASLVDSGAAPAAKPVPPPAMKPSASPAKAIPGVPMKITTERPAATESGRFRSDTRYKRARGKGLYYALAVVLVGGGVAAGGLYMKRERERRAAAAIAAAAAAPPLAAGQINAPPSNPIPAAPGGETATGAAGAAAAPTEAAHTGTPAPEKAEPAKPEPAVVKPEKPAPAAKAEGAKASVKAATGDKPEGAAPVRRRHERPASAATATATATEKPAEAAAAGEKKPEEAAAGEAKPAGETAKAESAKPAEGGEAKPAEGGEAKPAEGAKRAEAAAVVPPILKITSSPAGAEVVIDGVPVGSTPFSSKEIDPTGTHAITVKKDGFETHERMISGSDWSRGKGGAQSLKFNVKLRKTAGEQKPAEAGEKKEAKPEVEILTPSEP
jgi:uncharacterized protein (TIGR02266 family)